MQMLFKYFFSIRFGENLLDLIQHTHWNPNGDAQTDHLEHMIQWALKHFPCQTAEVSESALYKCPSNCRRPGKKIPSKTAWWSMFPCWGIMIKTEIFIKLNYFMAETEHQLRAEHSILPVWHTEWAFQRQTWEENVCSCTVQQWPQRVLFHQNTCSNDRGWTMKKMTQMADKDRPCSPLHSPPHTRLCFQFSELKQDGVEKGCCCWERERETGRGKRGVEEGQEGLGSPGSLERNRRALKAIYRPLGAGGGWGWVREQCGRHWDNQ